MKPHEFGYKLNNDPNRERFVSITEQTDEDGEIIYYGYEKFSDRHFTARTWQDVAAEFLKAILDETTQDEEEVLVIESMLSSLWIGGWKNTKLGEKYDYSVHERK